MRMFIVVVCMTLAGCSYASPATAPPKIDGVLADEEWAKARVEPLGGGGELFVLTTSDEIFLALRGERSGLASVCVSMGETVSVYHASAALGTAKYVRSPDGWQLSEGFTWEVRDSRSKGPASREETDAYFLSRGWIANSSSSGNRVREFRIRRPSGGLRLAAAFLEIDAMQIAAAPTGNADDCLRLELVRGETPATMQFTPVKWIEIK